MDTLHDKYAVLTLKPIEFKNSMEIFDKILI